MRRSIFPKPDLVLDLLLGMLALDPTRRLTAAAALQHELFKQVRGGWEGVEEVGLAGARGLGTRGGAGRACRHAGGSAAQLATGLAHPSLAPCPANPQDPLPSAASVFAGMHGRQAPAYPQRAMRPCQ